MGVEAFFFVDPIDEYCFQQLNDYSYFKLLCIIKENYEINQTGDEKKEFKDQILTYLQEDQIYHWIRL